MYLQFLFMNEDGGGIESAELMKLRSVVDADNGDETGNCYGCRVDYLCVSIALLKKVAEKAAQSEPWDGWQSAGDDRFGGGQQRRQPAADGS